MYHVSALGVDECMINVHYYYYTVIDLPQRFMNILELVHQDFTHCCVSVMCMVIGTNHLCSFCMFLLILGQISLKTT